jgi:hypothetical protein
MAEQTTPVEALSGGNGQGQQPELGEELARSREETLRLRDLLIAKDAELGAARGRLTELEASSLHLFNAVARVRALVPGVVWRALANIRRLRK